MALRAVDQQGVVVAPLGRLMLLQGVLASPSDPMGLITTLIVLAPFLESFSALVQQVVTFHLVAKKVMVAMESGMGNVHTLGRFFATNGVLSTAAIVGLAVTIMRRDWLIFPLLAWFLATLFVLVVQVPLFPQHAIVLIPPLIAIIALGLKDLPAIPIHSN
jgi:hypothetical protein